MEYKEMWLHIKKLQNKKSKNDYNPVEAALMGIPAKVYGKGK